MKLRQGNMFFHRTEYDIMLVTTNAMVRKDGALVMGRGAALEASKLWPLLPYDLGRLIKDRPEYGVIIPGSLVSGIRVGAFQVKHHWHDQADKGLIAMATARLSDLAGIVPGSSFAINFPGIGNGRLDRESVLGIIHILPDNVDVWEL